MESAASTRRAGLGEGKVKVRAFITYFTPGYPLPQLNILAGPEHEVEVRGFVDVRMDAVGEWGEEDPGAFMAKGAVEQLKLRTCTAGDVVLAWNSDKVGLYTDIDCEDKVVEDEGSVKGSRRAYFFHEFMLWTERDSWGAEFSVEWLWAKALEKSDVRRDINLSLVPVSGKAALDLVNLSIVEMGLETVAFTGDGLDGIPMQDHYKDMDGDNQRDEPDEQAQDNDISVAPEWVADDVDVPLPTWLQDGPDADDEPERNKHALVPRNTKFKVKAVFDLAGIDAGAGDVCAWATCLYQDLTLGSEENPVVLQKAGEKWEGTFQVEEAPDTIGVLRNFTWNWHVKHEGQIVACKSDSSKHTVFMCKEDLADYKPYDWVAGWSCAWSPADPHDDEAILDQLIERGNLESTGMVYKFPAPYGEETKWLLIYGKAGCGGWANLFHDLAKVQGIETDTVEVAILWPPWEEQWYLWAECFATFALQAINQPAEVYVYGDHGVVAYDGKTYDPTFAAKLADTWEVYMFSIIDRWAVEKDPFNPEHWESCRARGHPGQVYWVRWGDGEFRGSLIDLSSYPVVIYTWRLENPGP